MRRVRGFQSTGRYRLGAPHIEIAERAREAYSSRGNDFASARSEIQGQKVFARGEWQVETRTSTVVTATPEGFCVRAELRALERGEELWRRGWDLVLPRDLV